MSRTRTLLLLALAGVICLLGATLASGAGRGKPREVFTGTARSGTGDLRGRHAELTLAAYDPGAATATRKLTLVVSSRRCRGCLNLAGTLRGTIAPGPRSLPDGGQRYLVRTRGVLGSYRGVSVSGTAQGTGFVRQGRESLRVTMRTAHGTLTLSALSGPEPGFSAP